MSPTLVYIVEPVDRSAVNVYTVSVTGSTGNLDYTISDGSSSSNNASLDVADRANVTVIFTAKPGYVFTENGSTTIIKTVTVNGASVAIPAPATERGTEQVALTIKKLYQ